MYKSESSVDSALCLGMQDPYSSMMQQQQQRDPGHSFKSYDRVSASLSSPSTVPSASAFYGMHYGSQSFVGGDAFPGMTLPTSTAHEFAPLPAHMHSANNGLSRSLTSAHSSHSTHTVTSPQSTPNMGLMDMSSPLPSTSRLNSSVSPEHNEGMSHASSSSGDMSASDTNDNTSNHGNGNDSQDKDDPDKPSSKKRSTEDLQKDDNYWDKRKKNNESAKRSREARRMKEEQIALRVVYLEQENLQLRTEVSLLKTEIEKLRCMLYNS